MSLRNLGGLRSKVRSCLNLEEISKEDLREFKGDEEKYQKAVEKINKEKNPKMREYLKRGLDLTVEGAYQLQKCKEEMQEGGFKEKV